MKLSKLILPLMLFTLPLGACTPSSSTPGEGEEIAPGVTQADLDFNGITTDKAWASPDFKFGGILNDIDIGAWVVAGDVNPFDVTAKDGNNYDIKVTFDDADLFKYEVVTLNEKPTHTLTALKTGGTMMKIYAGEDMIWRNVVNARVPVRDQKLIFKKLAEADYWAGVLAIAMNAGDYRMFFDRGDEGLYNNVTMAMKESSEDLGTCKFTVDYENGKESFLSSFHIIAYPVNITQDAMVKPVRFEVTLSLDTIYVADKDGLVDFFRPVYL